MKALAEAYLAEIKPTYPGLHQASSLWIPRFLAFCEGAGLSALAQITPDHLAEYRQKLCWEPTLPSGKPVGRLLALNSVEHAIRITRRFLRWAVQLCQLEDPTQNLRITRQPGRKKPLLSREQYLAVLACPNRKSPLGQRDALILEILSTTGQLPKQLALLDLADVEQLDSTDLLSTYLQETRPSLASDPAEPALLLTQSGSRMSVSAVFFVLLKTSSQLGLPRISPKELSRTYLALQADLASQHRPLFL
jgi:site-specific recombinase XerD